MLREISRVLEAGGRVVICYSEDGPQEGSEFKASEIELQLRAAGFVDLRSTPVTTSETGNHYCTAGFKPDTIPAE